MSKGNSVFTLKITFNGQYIHSVHLYILVHYRDLMQNTPLLVIGTTGAVILVNAKTLEPSAYFSFKGKVYDTI